MAKILYKKKWNVFWYHFQDAKNRIIYFIKLYCYLYHYLVYILSITLNAHYAEIFSVTIIGCIQRI